jgi:hypothetical protein
MRSYRRIWSMELALWVVCCWSVSWAAHALIYFEDATFPELVTSGRALAMGNAFISKTDDSSAVFYNPAGLGTVRFPHLHLSNFHLETNQGLLYSSTGGSTSDISSNISKGLNFEGTRQLLVKNPGTFTHFRFNFMPNFTVRYLSVGYMFSMQRRATIDNTPNALFEFSERQDNGPYAGFNISLFGGIFKMGASAVYVNRKQIIAEQAQDVPVVVAAGDYDKGRATIGTGGVRLVLPITFLPTFSWTIHNAGKAKFSSAGGAGAPDPILMTQDVGFSITPQIGEITRVHLEVDYKDVGMQYENVSNIRRLMLGLELDIYRVLFVRAGYGDGFGSGGIGIKSRKLEFDLSTYAVDTSKSKIRGKEDRRYSLTISSGF